METKKDLFIKITDYFKDTEECVSLYGYIFKTKDYDFKTLHCFKAGVFINGYINTQVLKIYDLQTKKYAKIISKKYN